LKYKDKDGIEIELDFDQVEFDVSGNFILTGEDKINGGFYRFLWRSLDQDPIPEDYPPPEIDV
jgi:hypothetical protein